MILGYRKATTRHRDNATSRQRDIATTRHRDIATTRHRDITTSRQRDIATTRHRDIATTRQRDIATTRHRDTATLWWLICAISRCRVVALSRCRDVALSRCRVVALSRCRQRDIATTRDGTNQPPYILTVSKVIGYIIGLRKSQLTSIAITVRDLPICTLHTLRNQSRRPRDPWKSSQAWPFRRRIWWVLNHSFRPYSRLSCFLYMGWNRPWLLWRMLGTPRHCLK